MEEPKGGISVLTFQADLREPYMGNEVPITVYVYVRNGKVRRVELENPEGIKVSAKWLETFMMDSKLYSKMFTDVSP